MSINKIIEDILQESKLELEDMYSKHLELFKIETTNIGAKADKASRELNALENAIKARFGQKSLNDIRKASTDALNGR